MCEDPSIQPVGKFHQMLKWNPPFTLNITDIHPDIYGYELCNNVSTNCTYIEHRQHGDSHFIRQQHIFANFRTSLEFSITGINIVGKGIPTIVVYQPSCSYDTGECLLYSYCVYIAWGVFYIVDTFYRTITDIVLDC